MCKCQWENTALIVNIVNGRMASINANVKIVYVVVNGKCFGIIVNGGNCKYSCKCESISIVV